MTGLRLSPVYGIVSKVCRAIVDNLWKECVQQHFPTGEAQYKEKVLDMEQLWQFPYAWAAIDGCHLLLKCPAGRTWANNRQIKPVHCVSFISVTFPEVN